MTSAPPRMSRVTFSVSKLADACIGELPKSVPNRDRADRNLAEHLAKQRAFRRE
jgi:hypothetical protein